MAEHDSRPSQALPLGKAVVVIGAGTMGSGIAEVAAVAGHRVCAPCRRRHRFGFPHEQELCG